MQPAPYAFTSPVTRVILFIFPSLLCYFIVRITRGIFYTTDLFIECSYFVYIQLFVVFVLALSKNRGKFTNRIAGDDVFNVKLQAEKRTIEISI